MRQLKEIRQLEVSSKNSKPTPTNTPGAGPSAPPAPTFPTSAIAPHREPPAPGSAQPPFVPHNGLAPHSMSTYPAPPSSKTTSAPTPVPPSSRSPVAYTIITPDGKLLTSPSNPIPLNEQLRVANMELGEARTALESARNLNDTLYVQLAEFQRANTAYRQWESTAHNVMSGHAKTEEELKGENYQLKRELETIKGANRQLNSQVADLVHRNTSVNVAAARFREDLWHSEFSVESVVFL